MTKLSSVIGKDFVLYDINEDVTAQNLKNKVTENITFLLKREKLLNPGDHVIMPMGADDWEFGDENLNYSGNFEVFAGDGNTIIAYGHVRGYGVGYTLEEIEVTITEVTKNHTTVKPQKRSKSRKSRSTTTSLRSMR